VHRDLHDATVSQIVRTVGQMTGPVNPADTVRRRAAANPDQLAHLLTIPSQAAQTAPWPNWVSDELRHGFHLRGIELPYRHQVEAAESAHGGNHIVIATGTASGKSLGYLMPGLTAVVGGATMLYVAPTKALAHDQHRAIEELAIPGVRAAVFDGDTPSDERRWVREHANVILTNPDMLHHGVLPAHQYWTRFLKRLRFVVIDESHVYRGVFGAHISAVMRRLRRITANADPVFIACSATVADPGPHTNRLLGVEASVVDHDYSPHGERQFAFWEPAVLDEPRTALAETADLLSDLVRDGAQTLAFVRSRRGAEAIAATAQAKVDESLATSIAAYRGGYLPEERRALEADLRDGSIMALATTNALELGIDVAGLDAVIVAGWPGTRAALWQQFGRAGRSGADALGIFVARDDPLDTYIVRHADEVVAAPMEASVFDPTNPYVLDPHLAAAAAEIPLTDDEAVRWFGPTAPERLAALGDRGILRRRPTGWYWTSRSRASDAADLRGTGGAPVAIVEQSTGRLLGTVDAGAAHATVHDGAIYLHQGASYLVLDFDLDHAVAFVEPTDVDYTTHARSVTDISITKTRAATPLPGGPVAFGDVHVETQVVSYQRRRILTGELLSEHALDLPARSLQTTGVWWTLAHVPESIHPAGAAHAAEHAAIGLLPLFATCDRWDIGGVSTAQHPDTDALTVFVYDGYPGGAGFAERGFEVASRWLTATRDHIRDCRCTAGCPSCVQSPKCGNGNEPLDKAGAVLLLDTLLNH